MSNVERKSHDRFTLHTNTHEENSNQTTTSQKPIVPAVKPTPVEKKENK